MMTLIIKVICVYLAGVGFGMIVNLPLRAFNVAVLSGVVGWLVYYLVSLLPSAGLGISNFCGAMAIGLFSMIMARIMKIPSIVFDVPGLVPLVPGSQAYLVVKSFTVGDSHLLGLYSAQLVWISGSIALGFIAAEGVFRVWQQIKAYKSIFKRS